MTSICVVFENFYRFLLKIMEKDNTVKEDIDIDEVKQKLFKKYIDKFVMEIVNYTKVIENNRKYSLHGDYHNKLISGELKYSKSFHEKLHFTEDIESMEKLIKECNITEDEFANLNDGEKSLKFTMNELNFYAKRFTPDQYLERQKLPIKLQERILLEILNEMI